MLINLKAIFHATRGAEQQQAARERREAEHAAVDHEHEVGDRQALRVVQVAEIERFGTARDRCGPRQLPAEHLAAFAIKYGGE